MLQIYMQAEACRPSHVSCTEKGSGQSKQGIERIGGVQGCVMWCRERDRGRGVSGGRGGLFLRPHRWGDVHPASFGPGAGFSAHLTRSIANTVCKRPLLVPHTKVCFWPHIIAENDGNSLTESCYDMKENSDNMRSMQPSSW